MSVTLRKLTFILFLNWRSHVYILSLRIWIRFKRIVLSLFAYYKLLLLFDLAEVSKSVIHRWSVVCFAMRGVLHRCNSKVRITAWNTKIFQLLVLINRCVYSCFRIVFTLRCPKSLGIITWLDSAILSSTPISIFCYNNWNDWRLFCIVFIAQVKLILIIANLFLRTNSLCLMQNKIVFSIVNVGIFSEICLETFTCMLHVKCFLIYWLFIHNCAIIGRQNSTFVFKRPA